MLVEVQVASGPRIDQKTAYRVLFQLQATRIQQKKVLHEGRAICLQLEGVLVWAERLGKVITTWKLLVKLPPLILVFRRHGKLQKSNQELVYRSTKVRTRLSDINPITRDIHRRYGFTTPLARNSLQPARCNQIHFCIASCQSTISAQFDWRKREYQPCPNAEIVLLPIFMYTCLQLPGHTEISAVFHDQFSPPFIGHPANKLFALRNQGKDERILP